MTLNYAWIEYKDDLSIANPVRYFKHQNRQGKLLFPFLLVCISPFLIIYTLVVTIGFLFNLFKVSKRQIATLLSRLFFGKSWSIDDNSF